MGDVKKVVAKMRCVEKADRVAYSNDPKAKHTTVKLQPVYANEGPNKSWSEATPSGQVEMQITNQSAVDAFELGSSYLITFEKTED